jgi:uncharacterized membrane protein
VACEARGGDGVMPTWLIVITEHVVVGIDAMAMVLIVIGTVEAFVGAMRTLVQRGSGHERRDVWLRYGRWLIAGLTFQLAADILETSIGADWNRIGQLAAIAAIRTFLNYFLEKDLMEMRERQGEVV